MRHGATAWNEGGRWQGLTDNALGERGVTEARRLGARLAGLAFDRAESSDLARAVQTAELALPGRPLTLDPRLREIGFGEFEGLSVPEMAAHPAYAAWQLDPWQYAPPGGESLGEVAARMQAWATELPGGHTVAFSHSVAIRGLLSALLDWAPQPQPGYPLPFSVRLGHTSLSTLRRRGGVWTLHRLGDAAHLEPAPRADGAEGGTP
ncbi:phosphoglycerate mutase [Deinococcus sp. Leaf326]|nr:phosphoglycerate mutase [Deinococcus sp. Leaf326]